MRYPGLKEEYYLADFQPDPAVARDLGLDGSRIGLVLRPPADAALYHRFANPLFDELLVSVGGRDDVAAVVLPRTPDQAERIRGLRLPSVTVPEHAVDGPSLVAGADLVVSAGGTMNREAVVLGTPTCTRPSPDGWGGVDEQLVREGRLRPLEQVAPTLVLERRPEGAATRRRGATPSGCSTWRWLAWPGEPVSSRRWMPSCTPTSIAVIRAKGLRQFEQPVALASGELSRDFIDGKAALAQGADLELACRGMLDALGGIEFDAVGGLTMGADQFAHGIAMLSDSRWFVVRKEPKNRGTRSWWRGSS